MAHTMANYCDHLAYDLIYRPNSTTSLGPLSHYAGHQFMSASNECLCQIHLRFCPLRRALKSSNLLSRLQWKSSQVSFVQWRWPLTKRVF